MGDVGLGGEKLSAFISELPLEKRNELLNEIKKFFPKVFSIETRSIKGGWKELAMYENFDANKLKIESRHLSDGFLRILAILSQLLTTESVLLFDEIEDGVNQELVKLLMQFIVNSPHQTIIATHSPLILNYLEDEMAKRSILFVYRCLDGSVRVINFFDAVMKFQKLSKQEMELFGPGEWMQSVDLVELSKLLATQE
ncbi:hypothetical protein HCR_23350 (plasmid) [Hydrogenimonas cancrithermarum]|uniref:ATPase AAA-type core domain-containing protein n=2 Tax=Hydrogenimonas cancrithermarum TaxID=2993563 RepID=A0ABM8FNP8_9BACT|nr:hypothetical protein HCR_23350 [Hydrogenimonas cancrithermarum]